jgi:hypothetical protein
MLGAGVASAGGSKGSIGVGGEATSTSIRGNNNANLSDRWPLGQLRRGRVPRRRLPRSSPTTTTAARTTPTWRSARRFYYHVHSSAMADFGVGGSFGLAFIGDRSTVTDDSFTALFIEPGIQIRAFVASNVALSFTGGFDRWAWPTPRASTLTAQPVGAAGVHYYFF